MRILVVGTGSIGKRHISNLIDLCVEVDAYSYRAAQGVPSINQLGACLVHDLQVALRANYDGIVVANRTDLHLGTALEAIREENNIFIEKPLSISLAGVDDLLGLATNNNTIIEAGFMLRFHPNLRWIKQYLDDGGLGDLMHLRASVGQWLPNWRPGTDYRKGYSAVRKEGGGVIFDLIHELDVVYWLAGTVIDVTAMTRHVASLEIETESIAQIGLRLKSGALAQIHLDYVRPGYSRILEIVGTRGTLTWDYCAGTVTLSGDTGVIDVAHRVPLEFERNVLFREHMSYFLGRVKNPEMRPASSLNDAIEVLRIALACHRSAEERRCIRPEEIDSNYKIKESVK